MPGGVHCKRLVCRNLIFILMLSYISFATMLIVRLLVGETDDHVISSQNPSVSAWSAGSYLEMSPVFRRYANGNSSQRRVVFVHNDPKERVHVHRKAGVNNTHSALAQILNNFLEPVPLEIPRIEANHFGNFYFMHTDVFVYSAFLDDRKEETYMRVLTLTSQAASKVSIFCHFTGEIYNVTRKGERYELCENHFRKFGGYVFSCQVPEFLDRPLSNHVTISWGLTGQRVPVPFIRVKPPIHKLSFLDSYAENSNDISNINADKKTFGVNGWSKDNMPIPRLNFAICVPPLFGDISPHRLIEFIELSLLLGAKHIYFYKYSVTNDVFRVLSHYRDVVTVLPWLLPSSVAPDKVWYYGQLLAHNDCLYRAMPHFDLLAFNDIDEFIVPHQNGSKTWDEVFPQLLTNRTCGWSFLSTFYDPGIRDMRDGGLVIPTLTARSFTFSKIRTKVMVCPWRVFEVGIHHVSKQNRESWTVRELDPSQVFLHHYRRCVANYDMMCRKYVKDTIIEDRFGDLLRLRYSKAVADISV